MLKRIFVTQRGLRLEAANPEYDDIFITPDLFEEVRVLGRYAGHVNRDGLFYRGRAVQAA
jgi:SOS-response transcriptional repressor LexA